MKTVITTIAALLLSQAAIADISVSRYEVNVSFKKAKVEDNAVQMCDDGFMTGVDLLVLGTRKDFKLSVDSFKQCQLKSEQVVNKNGVPHTLLKFDLRKGRFDGCIIKVEQLNSGFPNGKYYSLDISDAC